MKKPIRPIDLELAEFEAALLRSIGQARSGEVGARHTPEQIVARRRGRPLGSVKPASKRPTTLRLDAAALARWRASGKGWQTRAAQLLDVHAPK